MGSDVGDFEPPAGSTVMPTAVALAASPSSQPIAMFELGQGTA